MTVYRPMAIAEHAFPRSEHVTPVSLRRWGWSDVWVGIGFAVVVCAVFPSLVWGTDHLWGDFYSWNFPSHEYAAQRLWDGAWPLWNPYMDCGMPFLGEADHGTFYPLSFLLHAVARSGYRLFRGLELFALAHLWWAACTMYGLLRTLGCRRSAAAVAGLTFGLSGAMVVRMAHVALLCAQSWVPVVLGGGWQAARYRRVAPMAWASAALGMVGLSGSPTTLTVLLVGLVVVVGIGACQGGDVAWRRRCFWGAGAWLAVVGTGGLLAGVQLIPTTIFVLASERMAYSYQQIAAYSVTPASLVMLWVPRFYGWLMYHQPGYWGPKNFVEVSGYVGVLPLGLALVAVRFRAWRDTAHWMVLAIVGLWMALGAYGGLHWLVYKSVPFIGMMRTPGRYLLLWVVGLSVLAGLGAEVLSRVYVSRERWHLVRRWLMGIGLTFLMIGIALGITTPSRLQRLEPWQRPLAAAGARTSVWSSGVSALGLLLIRGGAVPAAWLGGGLAAVVASDLVPQERGIGLYPRDIRGYLDPERIDTLLPNDPSLFRVKYPHRPPSQLMLADVQSESATARHLHDYQEFKRRIVSHDSRLLDMLNVKYLIEFENDWDEGRGPNLIAQRYLGFMQGYRERLTVLPAVACSGVTIVSRAETSSSEAIGTPIATLTLEGADGATHAIPIRIGIETVDPQYGLTGEMAAKEILPHRVWYIGGGERYFRVYLPLTSLETVREIGTQHVGGPSRLFIKELYLHTTDSRASWQRIHAERRDTSTVLHVYQNLDVLPRAFLVSRSRGVASPQEALDLLTSGQVDPGREVLVESKGTGQTGRILGAEGGSGFTEATVEVYEPERVVVSAHAPTGGSWLVLSDVYYPGWRARVDDRAVPVLRAYGLVRAVWLNPGQHRVEFQYRPAGFYVGAWCTGAGIVALLGMVWLCRRRSRVAWLAARRDATTTPEPGASG